MDEETNLELLERKNIEYMAILDKYVCLRRKC